MGWLPSVLLIALGLILLALLPLRLIGSLRRSRTAGESLRHAIDAGSQRLRGGVELMASWRAARRAGGGAGYDA